MPLSNGLNNIHFDNEAAHILIFNYRVNLYLINTLTYLENIRLSRGFIELKLLDTSINICFHNMIINDGGRLILIKNLTYLRNIFTRYFRNNIWLGLFFIVCFS